MRVDPYFAECDLWSVGERGSRDQVVAVGGLTAETIAWWTTRVPDRALFLRFVQEPQSAA
jgi:hypothetical protein